MLQVQEVKSQLDECFEKLKGYSPFFAAPSSQVSDAFSHRDEHFLQFDMPKFMFYRDMTHFEETPLYPANQGKNTWAATTPQIT